MSGTDREARRHHRLLFPSGLDRTDLNLNAIAAEQRHLIGLTHRLLGSLADAEDAVQETYARWYALSRQQREAIKSPGAWLTRVAGRVCLDILGSARARRENSMGHQVPEPQPGNTLWSDELPDSVLDPADQVTFDESIGMAFLVILELLTPAERVALVLHDVFRLPFGEVAEIVGRTPAACRQLATSARRRIHASRTSAAPTAQHDVDLVRAVTRAWKAKDIGALIRLLAPEATTVGDAPVLVGAEPHPIEDGEQNGHYALSPADEGLHQPGSSRNGQLAPQASGDCRASSRPLRF